MPELIIIREAGEQHISYEGTPCVREALSSAGIDMHHPCGGRGVCGQCRIRIDGGLTEMTEAERKAGSRLSCQTRLTGDARIWMEDEKKPVVLRDGTGGKTGDASDVTAVADIGTTTVAVSFYEEGAEVPFASLGAPNPQRAVSDDVIGRIQAALRGGKGGELQDMIRQCLRELAEKSGSRERIRTWILTGNTTMLYLATGRNPESLATAPFMPDHFFDETIELDGREAYLPPCVHGFVGADLLCAVLASGMCGRNETALLCDMGTNGEIAQWKNEKLYVTSVAMGPALEGVGLRNGCGAAEGAICRVIPRGGGLTAETIGGGKARGICGSGVIDAVAAGLAMGLIGTNGEMEEAMELRDGIKLYPEDVQAVILAKAAMGAGIETILQASGTGEKEIRKVYLCGGFGNEMNLVSAAGIGLIPAAFPGKAETLGNAALRGASILRTSEGRKTIRDIAKKAVHIGLGGNPAFNEAYIRQMRLGYIRKSGQDRTS